MLSAAACSDRGGSGEDCDDGACNARCIDSGDPVGGYCTEDGECRCTSGGDGDADTDADTDADGDGDADTCGNGPCDGLETCRSCPLDCGECAPVFSCDGTPCSIEECKADEFCCFEACAWGMMGSRPICPPILFADDLTASCPEGQEVPDWFAARNCFTTELYFAPDSCVPGYLYCPCTDGFYQWAESNSGGEPAACADQPPEQCFCEPSCAGRECGPDGCGGTCGFCDEGQGCNAGQCGAQSDACDQCLAGCAGDALCCIGNGCYCYEECTLNVPCPDGTELCCSGLGDCMCMGPDDCPF